VSAFSQGLRSLAALPVISIQQFASAFAHLMDSTVSSARRGADLIHQLFHVASDLPHR
jgi:hypothetical protein